MPLTTADETNLAKIMFQNIAWPNIGDINGIQPSVGTGAYWIGLFTADPTTAGTQTSETTYTGYARQLVVRSSAGFSVAGGAPVSIANAALVAFPNCTALPGSPVTFVGYCTAVTAGRIVATGALGASYQPAVGNAPQFAVGALIATIL